MHDRSCQLQTLALHGHATSRMSPSLSARSPARPPMQYADKLPWTLPVRGEPTATGRSLESGPGRFLSFEFAESISRNEDD